MRSASHDRQAKVQASTRRKTAITSGGKGGTMAAYLTDLLITPLQPVDPEVRAQLAIDTEHEVYQTFIANNPDIVRGDELVLTATGEVLPIRSVPVWDWRGHGFRPLIVERLGQS